MSGIRISYNTLVYAGEDISKGIVRLAKFGYDGVDFVGEPSQYDTAKIRTLLNENKIEASSICAIFNSERDFVSSSPKIRAQAIQYVKDCVDFATVIQAKAISVQATACMKINAEAGEEEEWAWGVSGIREAGLYAEEKGIRLTLEAWNRYETYLINRLDQALAMVKEINLPNVGVMGDTYHMNIEETNLGDAIRNVGDKLYYLHIADSNRAAPGRGHMNFDEIATALRDINYKGWVSMELLPAAANPFSGKVCKEFYDQYSEESIVFLKRLFDRIKQ
jgi:sugar phosphate isomerase/epimerase